MITTLFRRHAAAPAAPVFDPQATHDPESVDDLRGAVPTWRAGGDPVFWELVATLDRPPVGYVARALDVDELLVDGRRADVVVEVAVVEDVDVPTAALQLLPVPASGCPDEDLACPDCGVSGDVLPCRPKSRPDGPPLSRWHRRRRALVEHREAGSSSLVEVLVVAVLASLVAALFVLAAGLVGPVAEGGGMDGRPSRAPSPCPAGTAPGCPDGPWQVVVP